ncbi:hypothetical protein SISNIDRAFT_469645 [Sistotremastrum niveocremeum HHB9708]|uniref:Uncharacterized protein n=1 Tax=Sistotremastrum niveocremeum HHB9708 TaxID=1314777 RepID=A0A164PQ82_9AGAM|nr:hypothetical protein SISNIDRAFT_469645 [Sistotremastrum niveocremeum HHB9708]
MTGFKSIKKFESAWHLSRDDRPWSLHVKRALNYIVIRRVRFATHPFRISVVHSVNQGASAVDRSHSLRYMQWWKRCRETRNEVIPGMTIDNITRDKPYSSSIVPSQETSTISNLFSIPNEAQRIRLIGYAASLTTYSKSEIPNRESVLTVTPFPRSLRTTLFPASKCFNKLSSFSQVMDHQPQIIDAGAELESRICSHLEFWAKTKKDHLSRLIPPTLQAFEKALLVHLDPNFAKEELCLKNIVNTNFIRRYFAFSGLMSRLQYCLARVPAFSANLEYEIPNNIMDNIKRVM